MQQLLRTNCPRAAEVVILVPLMITQIVVMTRLKKTAESYRQSRQKFLNRVGDSSVYRTVCWMFLWLR